MELNQHLQRDWPLLRNFRKKAENRRIEEELNEIFKNYPNSQAHPSNSYELLPEPPQLITPETPHSGTC